MAKKLISWVYAHLEIILIAVISIFYLVTINDYGLTWDFHFHFFGGGHLLGLTWQQLDPRSWPYVEPDPRGPNAWSLPYGPVMSILPVASFLLFFKTLHVLAEDSAYNLPIILWGISGVIVTYLFLRQAINRRVAILGALFVALTPRFVGDLHNNMKDIPSAVAFTLNIWLLWRLVRYKRPIDLLWAVAGFALAFNVKVNAIYLPVVFGVWLLFTNLSVSKLQKLISPKRPFLWYFLLSPLAAFGVWAIFWQHPWAQIVQMYSTFGIGTNNIEVLLNGKWYCSGSTVPWYYPYWYLGITTPLPILLFAVIGIVLTVALFFRPTQSATYKKNTLLLFIIWLFVPLTRYFIHTIGVIDGIRHFEESIFPIAALASVSFDFVLSKCSGRIGKIFRIILLASVFIWLSWNIISYHPYEITYFNELVGGIHGAFGKYDLDYWGTSQKAAVAWINAHAPKNAKIYIVMAPDVEGIYLRPDLQPTLNHFGFGGSDFLVFLNRQSFYYRFYYGYEWLLRHKPVYTVTLQNTPLVWIYDNRTNNEIPRMTPWWQGEDPCIGPYWKNP